MVGIIKIEISPQTVTIKGSMTIKVTAFMVTWETVKINFSNWNTIKSGFKNWNDVYKYVP